MASGRAMELGLSLVLTCVAMVPWSPSFADPPGWSDDFRLTWTEDGSSTAYNNGNKVVCDIFGNAHVVWTESGYYDSYTYYMCKLAGGEAWTQPVCVDCDYSYFPALACDPWGNVHVAFCRGFVSDIYYRKYDGTSWYPIQNLTDEGHPSWDPSIAADALGRLHVVWSDERDGNEEIYYTQFDGASWGPNVRLTASEKIDRYAAVAADSKGVVHVVWVRNAGGWPLYYKRLDQSGWSPDTLLAPSFCNHPAIAVGPDDAVHVVWDGTDAEIYYKRRDQSGWSPKVRLTSLSGVSRYPSVAADASGNVHVSWFDNYDGNDEIYYCAREGTTWGPLERLTEDPGLSQFPAVAADGRGSVHLVWCDMRDPASDYEIYYKQRYAPGAGLTMSDVPVATPCKLMVSPNPARSEVELGFWLSSPGSASLAVIDIPGRIVWRGSCASARQGWNSANWTCHDTSGNPVAPGIYLARIHAGGSSSTAKIVVVE